MKKQRYWPGFAPPRWMILGIAVSGLVLGTGAIPVHAQSTSVRYGYSLLSEGRVDDAIATFQRAIQQEPNNLEALLGLGIAYRRAGRDADALETYQRILVLEPDNRLALSTLGYLGEFRPEWQLIGIESLTRLLELEPDSIDARAQRAKLYYFQGLFSESLADYAVILPQTTDPEVIGSAAEAYTFSGDHDTGLTLFDRYRSAGAVIQNDRAIAYAQALRESGQIAQAIQILEQELQRTADDTTQQIRLRGALASTYAANQDFQTALVLIQPLQGRPDSRLTLARALNAIGDYSQQPIYLQEAANLYLNVLTTTSTPTPGLFREASLLFSKQPEYRSQALQLVEQLRQGLPNDASLALQQQILQYQLGTLDRNSFFQDVRAAFPSIPSDPVQVRYMGQALSLIDPPVAELLPLYQSLTESSTANSFLYVRLAQIYIQQGYLENAKEALAIYVSTPTGSRDPNTIQLLLADIDRREGNLVQSAQRYEGLLGTSQSPSIRAGALQGLAAIYQTQGQFVEAIALYDQLIAENPQNFAYQMGRTALAYQAGLITEAQATTVLNQGLGALSYINDTPPPELITLTAVLPPSAERAELYQSLLVIDPGNAQLQLRSLQVLAETSPGQALAQAAQLIADNPNNLDWYFVQGEIAQQVGNNDLARESYTLVLEQQPGNQDALLALAGLEFQAGNYDQARTFYEDALALDGSSAIARTSLAALNAVQGRPLEAIQQLQAWQQEQFAQGIVDPNVTQQIQQIQEGLLLQRGIQPSWERF